MKAILLLIFISIIFLFCKEPFSGSKVDKDVNNEISTKLDTDGDGVLKKVEVERSLESERTIAKSNLEDLYRKEPEPMQILSSRILEIDHKMVVNQDIISFAKGSAWLDFRNDFSYSWFQDSTIFQKGKYHYSMRSDLLIMLPEDEKKFPSEWQVKGTGDVIVLVGTRKYYNNQTQLHMLGKERSQ